MTTRDPLVGMPEEVRQDFFKAPKHVQDAYLRWWASRPNKAAAHRDTWPAYSGGWSDLARVVRGALGPDGR